jgi:hypothetical protein
MDNAVTDALAGLLARWALRRVEKEKPDVGASGGGTDTRSSSGQMEVVSHAEYHD